MPRSLTRAALFVAGLTPLQAIADDDFRFKTYIEYKKATVTLAPTTASVEDARSRGFDASKVTTYQPNAVPSIGAGISFMGLGASHGMSLPQGKSTTSARGETKIQHTEIHATKKWYGGDLYRQSYRGFFRRDVARGDLNPLGDSLFATGEDYERASDMTMTVLGAAAFATLYEEDFPINTTLNPGKLPPKTGWSPLAMLSLSRTVIQNDGPLVPIDLQEYYGDDAALTGGTFVNAAILPGIGGSIVRGEWFLTPIGFCGISLQTQEFDGIDRSKKKMRGNVCDIRGTLGYSGGEFTAGIIGYKTVTTVTAETVNLSPSSSSLQMFVQLFL